MSVMINHEGATYSFSRGFGGEGGWLCVSGQSKGSLGSTPCYTYVHLNLSHELTRAAVEKNLGDHKFFSRYIKKSNDKPIRVTRPRKVRKSTGLFGMGLSLSSIFDSIDVEEEHEIEEYQEISTGV